MYLGRLVLKIDIDLDFVSRPGVELLYKNEHISSLLFLETTVVQ